MIEVRELEQIGDFCPSQWDAVATDGRGVYIRYRWGVISVYAGPMGQQAGEPILQKQHGHKYDGEMTTEEMLEVTGIKVVG